MSESRWSWDRRWAIVAGVSLALVVVGSLLTVRWLDPDCEPGACPSVDRLSEYRPDEPPQVFDANGDLAGTLSGARRSVVPLDSIPPIVREGYVAVEDRRFRDHGGVDVIGGVRAFLANLRSGEVEEGASTITMQLARILFGAEVLAWNKWHRKLAEVRLARAIEAELSKDRILELYLNQIYLGGGFYGVETAARHYFGKSVSEVNPREAAFLVGVAKNPEGYDPRDHPQEAAQRIATVLDVLERRGVIDAETAREAREAELELTDTRVVREWGANAYYLSAVRRELREIIPEPAQRAGVRVHTGLDQRAQAAAVEALVGQIRAVERGRWGVFRYETAPDSLPLSEGTSPYLQGMVVAMTPEEGLVTTVVGGRDYGHSEFDRAFQARRQPGSAFKPIVYAAAMGQGLALSRTIPTGPVRLARRGGPDWVVSGGAGGGELTVRDALVFSSNAAAVRVGQRVGTAQVARQARAMGIESEIPDYPSIFLGAADVVPAELVAAYATLGNGGHTVEPHLITRIENPSGHEVYRREPSPGQRAVDPRIAFLIVDVLRDVVTRGTGWRVSDMGFSWPAAGKTGTTNESRDLWFVGMTPELVAGVWLGFDDPTEVVAGAEGGQLAAPVWAEFMQVANRNLGPMEDWRAPAGVRKVRFDTGTGYAVPDDCDFIQGEVRTEYFLAGSEPMENCPYERLTDDRIWSGDTVGWDARYDLEGRDSLRADSTERRTIFYRGEGDAEERRQERIRRLDSIDDAMERRRREGAGERRETRLPDLRREAPRDTLRVEPDSSAAAPPAPDTTADTASVPTPPPEPDTTRPEPDTTLPQPDTTPPDTTRVLTPTGASPPGTAGGAGSGR